ncbi:UNVERIFIED_CONTAM: hypothetical protein O8I53_08425 [Campylobacter lari]
MFLFSYPICIYKFLFTPHSHNQNIPTMAIFASPANMLGLGFLISFNPNREIKNFLNNQIFYDVVSIILFLFCALSTLLYFVIYIKS